MDIDVFTSASVIDIKFHDLVYTVEDVQKGNKNILNGISGYFPSGKLIGIMGPSGAGKSTLLNIISGFQGRGFGGQIFINDQLKDQKAFKSVSCYITQDNDLNLLLTVEENMKFAADLKLGRSIGDQKKSHLIGDILESLGLDGTQKTSTAKLSGGQMKRLSVALELLSNPIVLFLDEPTTGLDSFGCNLCIKHLKKLAKTGKTIICTIHQPSASLFKMFDLIYVMSSGNCLYQGTVDDIITTFNDIDAPCDVYHNPADHVIELASGDYGEEKISLMVDKMKNGKLIMMPERRIETMLFEVDPNNNIVPTKSTTYELATLLKREVIKTKRNMTLTHLRVFASVVIAAAVSALFWRMGEDASKLWSNYNMMLAFVISNILGGLMLTILVFPTEMAILKKEHFNGYYNIANYLIAITIVDFPVSLLSCTILSSVVYPATGQPMEYERIAMFFATTLMLTLTAQSLGLFLGSAFNIKNGIFIGSYIHFPLMLVSGFGLHLSDLSPYFYWASYTSYLRYSLNSLTGAVYRYNRTKLPCPEDKFCIFTRGDSFLDEIGVKEYSFTYNMLMLLMIYTLLRTAAYVSMNLRV